MERGFLALSNIGSIEGITTNFMCYNKRRVKMNKTIGIVGSRRRNSNKDFQMVFDKFFDLYEINDKICSGGCPKGADAFAEIIANTQGISIIIHYPDKSKLDSILMKKNPRAAYAIINYARNTLIAKDSDVLIACVADDRKGGTEDTIKKFVKFHWDKNLHLV